MCVLAMQMITIDITQRSIRVQTYARKSRGSLCSLPRKLTKVTPSGVKVNVAEKIKMFIVQSRFVITLSSGGIFCNRLINEARYEIR